MSVSHITRYDKMPIPPLESQTEYIEAGPLRIGVEYRLLSEAIAAASHSEDALGGDRAGTIQDDSGVSLHVYGRDAGDREEREFLRFDCFREDPHYHYVSWRNRSNEMLHIDPVADGDPLAWALERLRTRLPQMLARAGATDLASRVDPGAIEDALPRIAQAAYRARYRHDDEAVRRAALGGETADA